MQNTPLLINHTGRQNVSRVHISHNQHTHISFFTNHTFLVHTMDNYITSLRVLINRSVTMVTLPVLALVINTQYSVIMYNYSLIITYWTKRSIDGYVIMGVSFCDCLSLFISRCKIRTDKCKERAKAMTRYVSEELHYLVSPLSKLIGFRKVKFSEKIIKT